MTDEKAEGMLPHGIDPTKFEPATSKAVSYMECSKCGLDVYCCDKCHTYPIYEEFYCDGGDHICQGCYDRAVSQTTKLETNSAAAPAASNGQQKEEE